MSQLHQKKSRKRYTFHVDAKELDISTTSKEQARLHPRKRYQFNNDPCIEQYRSSPYQAIKQTGEGGSSTIDNIQNCHVSNLIEESKYDGGKLQICTKDSNNNNNSKVQHKKGKKFTFIQVKDYLKINQKEEIPLQNNQVEGHSPEQLLNLLLKNQHRNGRILRVQLFFELMQIIDSINQNKKQGPQFQHILRQELVQWTSKALSQIKYTEYEKIPEILFFILNKDVEKLVNHYIKQGRPEIAYEVAILERNLVCSELPPSSILKKYKRQFNIVQIQNINMLGMSCWIYDLAVGVKYYNNICVTKIIDTIFQKYKKSDNFLCQLSLLGLINKIDRRNILKLLEQHIKRITNKPKQLGLQLDHIFLFSIFKKHFSNESLYEKIITQIFQKMNDIELYIDIIQYSGIQSKTSTNLLKKFAKQYNLYNPTNRISLYFRNKIHQQTKNSFYRDQMNEVLLYGELLHKYSQQKYQEFIDQLRLNYQILNMSSIVQFQTILNNLAIILTSFSYLCRPNKQQRRKYQFQLKQIQQLLRNYKNQHKISNYLLINIVRGSIAFIEIQRGIFNLNQPGKIENLQELVLYLKQKMVSDFENCQKFLKYIEQVCVKTFLSIHGKLFIQKIMNLNDQNEKKYLFDNIPFLRLKDLSSLSDQIKQNKMIKILNIINCRKEIKAMLLIAGQPL